MNQQNTNSQFLSVVELAKLLGVSRVTVFNRIKKGEINAVKVGRNFIIEKNSIPFVLSQSLSHLDKKTIEQAMQRTVIEYGQTLRLLGAE